MSVKFGLLFLTVCTIPLYVNGQAQQCFLELPITGDCSFFVNDLCYREQIIEVPVGGNITVNCPEGANISTASFLFFNTSSADESEIDITGDRYTLEGSTLTIQNVQSIDDGRYNCRLSNGMFRRFCVTVVGTVDLQSCPTDVPGTPACIETIQVNEGSSVTFDTRLTFTTPGSCRCRQQIQSFRFFSTASTVSASYSCVGGNDSTCETNFGAVEQIESSVNGQYNFFLTIPPLSVEISSTSFALLVQNELPNSVSMSSFVILKVFNVEVLPSATTDPDTTSSAISAILIKGRSATTVLLVLLLTVVIM